MARQGRKTGRKGGQWNNKLAVKHGAYIKKWDGRTREAKAIHQIQAELVTALGDVTPQETLIIQRASVKALRCALVEAQILQKNGDAPERLKDEYLRWSRELRRDLVVLGLERRAKPVQGLQAYLQESQKE